MTGTMELTNLKSSAVYKPSKVIKYKTGINLKGFLRFIQEAHVIHGNKLF